MVRQRSKNLSAGKNPAEKQAQSHFYEQNEEQSDTESVEMADVGEDEEELAKLVLGDDAGFIPRLGQEITEAPDADYRNREDQVDLEREEAEDNLEDIDDAEVVLF